MAALVEVESKRSHPLGESTVIGRGKTCQIQIDDPLVSPSHAAITQSPEGFQVRDLGSRRGTFVGARKVSEAPLRDGDELMIGPVRYRFEERAQLDVDREELVRLRAIVELGAAIGVEHDLERLLARVLDTCFQLLPAGRGALVIYEPNCKSPFMTVTRSRTGSHGFPVSTALLGQVMVTHQPYLTQVIDDVVLQRAESLVAHNVRSVMAVPLRYDNAETEWLGVILLDSEAGELSRRDLELLQAIATPTALAIKNAMLVRQVQTVIGDEWRRLERVVRDLPLGVVVLDDRRRCVMVNQWARARQHELGVRPGAEIAAIAGVACDKLTGGDLQTTVTTESDRILSLTASSMKDGRETVIVIDDVTQERERLTQAAHRDRVALIGQLAGGVAHDFNNLLHVILTYADLLEDSLQDPGQRDDAHQISHAARTAAELTRQLLTFSRRELVKPKVVDLAAAVRSMEKIMIQSLGATQTLDLAIEDDVPWVLIDTAQLEQIVINLVANARDAMPNGGAVAVRVGPADIVDHPRLPAGSYAAIEVVDTGGGMAPEVLARIFEPYFTTKARGKGTGLGLATVHGIVQQACGEIAVDSAPGQGTTFHILLPAAEQTGEEPGRRKPNAASGATILVVDDDDQVRRVTERMLRNAGYRVLSASSAQGALAVVAAHADNIDLVLTDLVMPGMCGRDLARELEVRRPQSRIIFMSGYHQHAPMTSSQFLSKPFNRVQLLDKMREALPAARGASMAAE